MNNAPCIAFIGAGNMAASLIGGLRAQGSQSLLRASDHSAEQRAKAEALGASSFAENAQAIAGADLIVLSVKPQVLKAVCLELASHLQPQQLVISIAAGISCDSLKQWLGERALVRCMPNTPALLREGMSGLYATAQTSEAQRQQAQQLLSAVGRCVWVEQESLLDAVTAVSGSGPAYFFLLIEAMIAAGQQLGLTQETATLLTQQTALGAARMALASDCDAATLRRQVTSPGGTTEAAINSFQQSGFNEQVLQALTAAAQRSAELARLLGQ